MAGLSTLHKFGKGELYPFSTEEAGISLLRHWERATVGSTRPDRREGGPEALPFGKN